MELSALKAMRLCKTVLAIVMLKLHIMQSAKSYECI